MTTALECHRQGGPPLIVPAAVLLLLTVALGTSGPRQDALAYDLSHHALFTVLGAIVFAVSVALAVWTGGASASSASLRRPARSACPAACCSPTNV